MVDQHTDNTRLVVWVLWLVGHPENTIGRFVGKRKKQIAGIVNRSPYPNRAAMTMDERRTAIADLMRVRVGDDGKPLDGGLLDRVKLEVLPLRASQVKRRVP